MADSNGNSKGMGKGMAKGKGPPAPPAPPPSIPIGAAALCCKGKGKGKCTCSSDRRRKIGHRPPSDLLAPTSSVLLRNNPALESAKGTVWEGLDLWGQPGATNILEGFKMDYAALARLWEPMAAPPILAAPVVPRRNFVLPARIQQQVEIAVAGAHLTPQLVQRALTEDMGILSAEQATVLYNVIVPCVPEADAIIRGYVQQHGDTFLNRAEATMWALSRIPLVEVRASLLVRRHFLEEEQTEVSQTIQKIASTLANLQSSRPFRTVLQAILATSNILSQKGFEGYCFKSFTGLQNHRISRHAPTTFDPETGELIPISLEWAKANNPSILALVAGMLEKTHEYRCRLRFLRMLAVGQLVQSESVCRKVWSYLDDLAESPRDALMVLAECKASVCSTDLLEDLQARAMEARHSLRDLSQLKQAEVSRSQATYSLQVSELKASLEQLLELCTEALEVLDASASDICRLAGQTVRGAQTAKIKAAGEIFHFLRVLGSNLEKEMLDVQRKRVQHDAHVDFSSSDRHVRKWQPVQVDHLLLSTRDPDLIRQLRHGQTLGDTASGNSTSAAQQNGRSLLESSAGNEDSDDTSSPAPDPPMYVDLVHGGLEGKYCRDPATGRWGQRFDGMDGTSAVELQLGGPRALP
eukprot:TRINITY_DN10083_c4_g1_i1.p1 TRINITY_DN10083_c4_g1~~TRINITY_DN10083_c4_g1_i1.p1  ORF type:complete len:640 (-),score=109.54 TRINITY_DN10083_c4_g1_i1:309-2228(-)